MRARGGVMTPDLRSYRAKAGAGLQPIPDGWYRGGSPRGAGVKIRAPADRGREVATARNRGSIGAFGMTNVDAHDQAGPGHDGSDRATGPEDAQVRLVVAGAVRGDAEAWRSLVEMYGARVFALAKSRVRRADLAEEITQSVFATIAIKMRDDGYRDEGRFESWLFRIAMNRVRDECRRERRHATPTDPVAFAKDAGDAGEGPSSDSDREELGALREALAALSDADREVIELRHHAQMSFKQIAAMVGEPMGTLLARHHRALRKLREIMGESTTAGELA